MMRFGGNFYILRRLRPEQCSHEQQADAAFHAADCTSSERINVGELKRGFAKPYFESALKRVARDAFVRGGRNARIFDGFLSESTVLRGGAYSSRVTRIHSSI